MAGRDREHVGIQLQAPMSCGGVDLEDDGHGRDLGRAMTLPSVVCDEAILLGGDGRRARCAGPGQLRPWPRPR